jgi:hypothetical protein
VSFSGVPKVIRHTPGWISCASGAVEAAASGDSSKPPAALSDTNRRLENRIDRLI